MRALVVTLVIAAGGSTSCTQVNASFVCTDSASCREGAQTGMCQPNGSCSFPDGTCASGQRYGGASAPGVAGVCVGDEPTGDGGMDVPPATDSLMA